MPKENRKIIESSFNQRRVCEFESSNWFARNVSDGVLQYSPYLDTPLDPASWGPSALAQSERRQRQGPEGAPYPANLAENETRTKDRLHYPKRYESTHLLHAGPEVYVYNEIA